MARKVGVHVYTLRVKEPYQRDFEVLSSINDEHDLIDILLDGMRALLTTHKKDESAERMECMKRVTKSGRTLTGIFTVGHYGEATDIVSAINAQLSYEKQTTDAEMLPCFFRLDIPEDRDEALLILQRDNRIGSKAAFVAIINLILAQLDIELKFRVTPLVNKEEFDRLVNDGQVQSLRFIKMGMTDDLADSYDTGHQEVKGSVEFVVKARKGGILPFKGLLRRFSGAGGAIKNAFELDALDFDTVKAEVKIGQKVQTIDFGKKLNTPIVDLTGRVRFGTDGHPTFASLSEAAGEVAQGFLESMYG